MILSKPKIFILAIVIGLVPLLAAADSVFSHIHNRVPQGQQQAAAEWYQEIFGGQLGKRSFGPGVELPNGFLGSMPFNGPVEHILLKSRSNQDRNLRKGFGALEVAEEERNHHPRHLVGLQVPGASAEGW